MLDRRAFLISAASLLPLGVAARAAPGASLSAQDRTDIARIEAYLNGLKTLKAHFMQVAGDGGISEGTAWLERPGRMRFQYDPPAPFLLIAAHGQLIFRDWRLPRPATYRSGVRRLASCSRTMSSWPVR